MVSLIFVGINFRELAEKDMSVDLLVIIALCLYLPLVSLIFICLSQCTEVRGFIFPK
jgi:hypothetical protein